MKKVSILLILVICPSLLFGQPETNQDNDDDEIQTLFGKGTKVTGFGAFDLKLTEIAGQTSLILGGSGGAILNHKWIVGAGGYGIATNVDLEGQGSFQRLDLNAGYGGLILGYMIAPREIVHVAIPVLVGAGGTDISSPIPSDQPIIIESGSFFVVEPGIQAEVNITSWFRIGIGASYRIVEAFNSDYLRASDLEGLTGNFALKFGKF